MRPDLIKLELFIANLLRKGVFIAGFLILVGWAFQINFTQNVFLSFQQYNNVTFIENLNALITARDWPKIIAYAGLIVLICLPIIRVLATGFIFAKQKNYRLLSLVGIVFVGLVLSVFIGFEF
jgi:uncharacterized membrane protein